MPSLRRHFARGPQFTTTFIVICSAHPGAVNAGWLHGVQGPADAAAHRSKVD
jgi:hypothetical protein